MQEINIDATDLIVGRLGSYAAKQALLGNVVNIVHAEKAVMTGSKKLIVAKYHQRRTAIGRPNKGPFILRSPDRFLKRQIRGMLPFKKARGSAAFRRIKCYKGVPDQLKDRKLTSLPFAHVEKKRTLKIAQIAEICKALGGKV